MTDVTDAQATALPAGQRIAVIGAGVAGLGAAWLLSKRHQVTLFEANGYPGGHSNTVEAEVRGRRVVVDTGFIVFNDVNYPNLLHLFDRLKVPSEPSNMSFALSLDDGRFEYASSLPFAPFAQASNLLRPHFLRMLWEIPRFYREALALQRRGVPGDLTIGELLARGGYSDTYRLYHLLPMAAAIWSTPLDRIGEFPAGEFIRFYDEHGLLRFTQRPRWRTVAGGSREYVRRVLADFGGTLMLNAPVAKIVRAANGVTLHLKNGGQAQFDQVVCASHADQTLRMLEAPGTGEREVLGSFTYAASRAILHSDARLMPKRRAAWSSWNFEARRDQPAGRGVALTYWMNQLQNLDPAHPLFVSLNPWREPAPENVIAAFDYEHPVYTLAAPRAQKALPALQGINRTWFCGSYCGYGFHEDAFKSGLAVAEKLGASVPWGGVLNVTGKPVVVRPAA